MGRTYTITFTTGLIDKLAGRAKPPPPEAPSLSRPRAIHPELLALKHQDAQLTRALTLSERIGSALVKTEAEEAKQLQESVSGLLSKYSTSMRPLPCQAERTACQECYAANKDDVLRCSELVKAYSSCASQVYALQTQQINEALRGG